LPESSLVVLASGSGLAGTGRFLFGVVFISSQIYLSSANTGLLGGLVVVAGGGLLIAGRLPGLAAPRIRPGGEGFS
jgi:hypothetical protein